MISFKRSYAVKLCRSWVRLLMMEPEMVHQDTNRQFLQRVKNIIRRIPQGKVASYKQIAYLAGNHRAARQVGWILHSSSEKDKLPWHRVVNSRGIISLRTHNGYDTQKRLLEKEGVRFDEHDRINLQRYLWQPQRGGRDPGFSE